MIKKIDKKDIHRLIEQEIEAQLLNAKLAASQAYDTATHAENKAENKYDTLGLEAAYLAEGQSKRVIELEQELTTFQQLKPQRFDDMSEIGLGALIFLSTIQGDNKCLFISPISGGTSITYQSFNIVLITPSSPLGKLLIGKCIDDSITINQTEFMITSLF